MEHIYGHIESIVFQSPDTGFTVARLKEPKKRDTTCIVGIIPALHPGETVHCSGSWKNTPNYGIQFAITEYHTEAPATIVGIKKYLESGLVKGIGPTYAKRIVEKFGLKTLDVIENNTESLLKIAGIGKKRVSIIKTCWHDQKAIRDVMIFLQSFGVTPAYAQKIFKKHRGQSIEKVKENPYCLAKDIRGIGFKTADTIAKNLGIPHDSGHRIEAGIEHSLSELSSNGHVCYPLEDFVSHASEILEVSPQLVKLRIEPLENEGRIVVSHITIDANIKPFIWLKGFYIAENGIAHNLERIHTSRFLLREIDSNRAIDWVQKKLNFTFDDSQRHAIGQALVSKVQIITGGPGTGKSTIIAAILTIINKIHGSIILAAPTGRAAKRMAEITGIRASTIHSLLKYDFSLGGFKHNTENPIDCDILIVDEASMIDTSLMYSLLKAIPNRAKVILVGDINQLPSVGPGNVLMDIIHSKAFPTTTLTHIFRQAAGSKIIINAHSINRGYFPDLRQERNSDFFFIEEDDPQDILRTVVNLVVDRLPKTYGFHPIDDIQVISPMKRGIIGIENFNTTLQESVNPKGRGFIHYGRKFLVGDKVMQIKNNYNKDIYNGDIGRITHIDTVDMEMIVTIEDRIVEYDFSELDELVLAYTVSVHKYQGCECPCIIMPIHTAHFIMLHRNLLYTGVTRGKKLVVLVGTKKALAIAVKNDTISKRHTGLRQALHGIKNH